MSTTELSDVFEFHIKRMPPSLRDEDVQRTLDAAVAEAAQEAAAVTSASAELQGIDATVSETVVLLHVVLTEGAPEAAARSFIDTCLTPQLEKRHIEVSQVRQRNTSGDN
jgi:hypothetical protein